MSDRYAVIGHPVAHSLSPKIHSEFARQTQQDLVYVAIAAALDGFAETARAFFREGGQGLNVTLPFKQQAFRFCAAPSARAQEAHAVNTIFLSGGTLAGDNTDGVGLVTDIQTNLGVALRATQVLLLGAGGAAAGVIGPLLKQRPQSLFIANRNRDKAEQLVLQFVALAATNQVIVRPGDYTEIGRTGFDVVINATSASLSNHLPPLSASAFLSHTLAYDMMYGVENTPFLRFAQESGAGRMADGTGMLVEQAAESFYLWRGVRPNTAPVIAQLKVRK